VEGGSLAVIVPLIRLLKDVDFSVALPATPAFICCVGTRVVEYRIFVACRNSTVCAISPPPHQPLAPSCTA
jgi:hypothetical protein